MGSYGTDISPLRKRFWIAVVFLLITAVLCVSQIRSRRVLEKTRIELLKAKAGLVLLRETSKQRKHAVETLKAMYTQGSRTSAERLVYGKIDELSARLKPDDVTISAIESKGDEVSLQFVFKFINPNHTDFLNNISYLEGNVFPLTMVSAVSITRTETDGKSVLTCSVTGRVLTTGKGKP